MTSSDSSYLELFPLGIVLVPGEVVPLHIFEPRYRRMIEERLDGGDFGIVLGDDEGLRRCGCTARVVALVERLEEGRMNILAEGVRRFRLGKLHAPDEPAEQALAAEVSYFEDVAAEAPAPLAADVSEAYAKVLEVMDVAAPGVPPGEAALSFRIAAAVDFGAAFKQELLESRREEQRLEMLLVALRELLPRLEAHRLRRDAIRGNGKGN